MSFRPTADLKYKLPLFCQFIAQKLMNEVVVVLHLQMHWVWNYRSGIFLGFETSTTAFLAPVSSLECERIPCLTSLGNFVRSVWRGLWLTNNVNTIFFKLAGGKHTIVVRAPEKAAGRSGDYERIHPLSRWSSACFVFTQNPLSFKQCWAKFLDILIDVDWSLTVLLVKIQVKEMTRALPSPLRNKKIDQNITKVKC